MAAPTTSQNRMMRRQQQQPMMLQRVLVVMAATAFMLGGANALFADEVGQTDFLKQTAGHGGPLTMAATTSMSSLITSTATYTSPSNFQALEDNNIKNNNSHNNPCYIASRKVTEDGGDGGGDLLWRRNVCTTSTAAGSPTSSATAAVGVAMTSDNKYVLTVDGTSGIVQKWSSDQGELLWNTKAPLSVTEGGESGDNSVLLTHNGAMGRVFSFGKDKDDTDQSADVVFAVTSHDALPSDDNSKRHYRHGPRHTEILSVFASTDGEVIPFEYGSPDRRHKDTASMVTGISAGQLLDDHVMKLSSVNSELKASPRFVNVVQLTTGTSGDQKVQLFVIAAHVPADSTVTTLGQIGVFQIDYDDLVTHKKWNVVEAWSMKDVLGRHGAALLDVSTFTIVATPTSSGAAGGGVSGVVVKKHPPPSPGVEYAQGKNNQRHDELLAFGMIGAAGNKPLGMTKYDWTEDEEGDVIESITAEADSVSGGILVHVHGSKSSAIVKYNSSGGSGSFDVLAGRKAAAVMPSITLTAANCGAAIQGTGTSMIHIRATNSGLLEITKVAGDTVDVAREETVRRTVHHEDSSTPLALTHLFTATCSSEYVDLVLGSGVDGSTTVVVRVSLDKNDSFATSTLFQAEEALANIQSTIVMDASSSHVVVAPTTASADEDDDEDIIPSLADRLLLQAASIPLLGGLLVTSPLLSTSEDDSTSSSSSRDVSFGFQKTIVALTKNGQLYGLDTQRQGQVIWSLDVASAGHNTHNHALVYSGKDHGHHHGHSHEFLVVSQSESSLMWKCVDGVHGNIIKEGSVVVKKDVNADYVVQTMGPVRLDRHGHGSMGCHQQALVLYENGAVDLVPSTEAGTEALNDLVSSSTSPSPFYMHSIDRSAGALTSVKIVSSQSGSVADTDPACAAGDGNGECKAASTGSETPIFSSLVLGETLFNPTKERIVNVAYPNPEEVVQRPVTILGDDSLLLKYLNPHLAVIVTEATPAAMQDMQTAMSSTNAKEAEDDLVSALAEGDSSIMGSGSGNNKSSATKKKPMGATPVVGAADGGDASSTGTSSSSTPSSMSMPKEAPSLFINIVDTVAGKLLYRVSHTTATSTTASSSNTTGSMARARNVPVTISENWIVYSFWNDKSKRTEVGVVTLHEGMIDKHGLTAFQGLPEDETTTKFTSLESPRPIVLSRTYSLSKQVVAIGFTQTARGISSKQLVLALGNGQVATLDRRFLDPRRPSGDPKPEEKLEGLFRYSPVLPLMPERVASYYHAVEGVTHVTCAAAHIESQTFILAYGGPDLFMARVAPSKGFDLLPENFSKGLLSVVVLGLVAVTATIHSMSQQKLTSVIWS
jgi:hypothetical protein